MIPNRKIWVLIQRYVTGNAGPEERRKINRWMEDDPENRKLIQELEQIWRLTREEDFEVNVQDAWERFRFRSTNGERRKTLEAASGRPSKSLLYLLRAAAAILVIVSAGLFAQLYLSGFNEAEQQVGSHAIQMQELVTGPGEKARVSFSDYSEVTLNASSSLRFPEEFHGAERKVYLDGEAYFKVAHNPEYPFIVHAGRADVRVLGTEFNVRGWSEDPAMEVVVREGKVSVSSSDDQMEESSEVILTDGLFTRVNRGEAPSPPVQVDTRNYLLWTSGGMHFNEAPFRQVIRDIERRFDVRITVSDPDLMDVPYTGTFQDAELSEVLSVIAASMEVGYSREGSVVEFY